MRLIRPIGGRSNLVGLVLLILILAVVYHFFHKHQMSTQVDKNANVSLIDNLSNSKSLADKRNLASAYLANGQFAKAEDTIKQVANSTKDVNDYLQLLNICVVQAVPDKQTCVEDTVGKLKPMINSMPFYTAYATAAELDSAGFKKDSVAFYQRAYDAYDSSRVEENMKTKDQIKQRIDQINA